MSYTTTELVELTKHTAGMIIKTLEDAGYKHVDTGHHGVKIRNDECLDFLKNRIVKQKEFVSINSLASKNNVSNDVIRQILCKNNIKPAYYEKGYIEYYEHSADDFVTQYFIKSRTANEELHPLVKDKRCLNLYWFPDIIPKCFEDLAE